MNISIDHKGYVNSWAYQDEDLSMRPIIIPNEMIPEDWNDNAFFYKWDGEQLIFDEDFKNTSAQEEELFGLRQKREQECFSIINRGQFWYNDLTQEQLKELREWYDAWLKVTETLKIPDKPEWLNEKI